MQIKATEIMLQFERPDGKWIQGFFYVATKPSDPALRDEDVQSQLPVMFCGHPICTILRDSLAGITDTKLRQASQRWQHIILYGMVSLRIVLTGRIDMLDTEDNCLFLGQAFQATRGNGQVH